MGTGSSPAASRAGSPSDRDLDERLGECSKLLRWAVGEGRPSLSTEKSREGWRQRLGQSGRGLWRVNERHGGAKRQSGI